MSTFEKLYKIDVNGHKEGKNGLSYLSWTWAWAEVKKAYPDAAYTIRRFENDLPYVYDEMTGYMVFTDVTIDGLTHEMWLPVMDNNNKAMKSVPYKYKTRAGKEMTVKAADMFDINKTIMRCLTKNLAMFGLGLYIYAGEDLPEEIEDPKEEEPKEDKPKKAAEKKATTAAKSSKADAATTAKDVPSTPTAPKIASLQQIQMIRRLAPKVNKKEEDMCKAYKVARLEDLTVEQAANAYNVLKNYEAKL